MKNIVRCSLLFMALLIAASVTPGRAFAFDEETNKKVLKDAVVGAVTGFVAVEATKGDQKAPETNISPANVSTTTETVEDKAGHHGKGPKRHGPKEGHRPPGWDKGKKTGWHGSDVPPGLTKK